MPVNPAKHLQQRGEALAATLPPLLVAAERVASTVAQGVHGRRRVGQGETFWQFRQYEPGDRPQLIDWRQTAKSDRVYVRELEWEAAQSVWLWRDQSRSMNWRSISQLPTKRDRADLLVLALIVLLVRAGERVCLLGSGRLPRGGRQGLLRCALALEREAARDEARYNGEARPADATTETEGLAGSPAREPLPRHARLVLVGDFLGPVEPLEAQLRFYAERGVTGHLLQILDPAESAFPFEGRLRFEGLEGEASWLLGRVEAVRDRYIERLHGHQSQIADLARRLGWTLRVHHSDRPPQEALLSLYTVLSEGPSR